MAKNPKNNIDKAMEALQGALDIEPVGQEVQLPEQTVEFEGDVELLETPDGGAEVNFEPNAPIDKSKVPFDANLADYLDDIQLGKLASDFLGAFEADKDSRKDWHDTYIKGLDMLGFKYEDRTQPFEGASGSYIPY